MGPRALITRHPWITFNVALFSSYAAFGVLSFFVPQPLEMGWAIPLHLGTLLAYLLVAYGLVRKIFRMNYVVAAISALMVVHLLIFTFVPLGIQFAYLGPSRSFYFLLLHGAARAAGERNTLYILVGFNVLMMFVHGINICYFSSGKTAALFRPGGEAKADGPSDARA